MSWQRKQSRKATKWDFGTCDVCRKAVGTYDWIPLLSGHKVHQEGCHKKLLEERNAQKEDATDG